MLYAAVVCNQTVYAISLQACLTVSIDCTGAPLSLQHHQHLFCARLDLAVDDPAGGKGLVVSEVSQLDMTALPLSVWHCIILGSSSGAHGHTS
jgi:hypothetical protein